MKALPLLLVALSCGCWQASFGAGAAAATTNRADIPYVPSRHDTVKDLLWLADVGTNDVVYDLGSGDGRIVIAAARDFHARKAVGVEMHSDLVEASRTNAQLAGVADRVAFIQGNLFTTDVSDATVVVLYLGWGANLELRSALLQQLKPGTRIVSHQFGMGEWQVDKKLTVRTPLLGMYSERHNSFASNRDTPDYRIPFEQAGQNILSGWIVPARVAGVWRSTISTSAGAGELTLVLHQRLSGLEGSFRVTGATNFSGRLQTDLWGTHLRMQTFPTNAGYFGLPLLSFDGHVTNDTITGTVTVSEGRTTAEPREWSARRGAVDWTGIWTWPGPNRNPVELKIERQQGRLVGTYDDPSRDELPYRKHERVEINDIYDFGGGFYFTHLLGAAGGTRRMGTNDGWLIGEGVIVDGTVDGTIAFYPYPDDMFPGIGSTPRRTNNVVAGRVDWHPTRRSK